MRTFATFLFILAIGVAFYATLIAMFGFAETNSLVNVVREGQTTVSGFWMGLWHGLVVPIAFIAKMLGFSAGIYDVNNNGVWYDCGFLLGVGVFVRCAI